MDEFQLAFPGQLAEVTTDGRFGHVQPSGQIMHSNSLVLI
jgi:hypothetical protein